jgi:hypothetical protein
MKAEVDIKISRKTDSIILGYNVAEFEDEKKNIRGNVVGSGSLLRVTVDGVSGYADIDTSVAVNAAIAELMKGR